MNRQEFYDYIMENFEISGEAARLISNILWYIETYCEGEEEQKSVLYNLLDGTIGLTDEELCMLKF